MIVTNTPNSTPSGAATSDSYPQGERTRAGSLAIWLFAAVVVAAAVAIGSVAWQRRRHRAPS